MKIHSKALLKAIEKINGAMPRSTVVVYEYKTCIALEFDGETLWLTCTNGTLFLKTGIPAERTEEDESWTLLAEYQPLMAFISYVDKEITLSLKEGHLRAQCGRAWAKIDTIQEIWPMPELEEETGHFELSMDQFKILNKSHMPKSISGRDMTECINLVTTDKQLYALTANGFIYAIVPIAGELGEGILFDVGYAETILKACTKEDEEEDDAPPISFVVHGVKVMARGNGVFAMASLTNAPPLGARYVSAAYHPDVQYAITVGFDMRRALRTIDQMDLGDQRTVEIYSKDGSVMVAWDKKFLSDAVAHSENDWGDDKEFMFSSTGMLDMLSAIGGECTLMIVTHPNIEGGIWFILEKDGARCTVSARRVKPKQI